MLDRTKFKPFPHDHHRNWTSDEINYHVSESFGLVGAGVLGHHDGDHQPNGPDREDEVETAMK